MKTCHANDVVHGFLRPENIIVGRGTEFSDVRIINFPLSVGYEGNTRLNEKYHYPHFLAPEIFGEESKITEKCDAWSCGALMYFLLCGKVPFDGDTDAEVISKI